MKVMTTKGMIERSELTVKDEITESDNARTIAACWYLGDELVRRSVWVDVLRGVELNG